MLCQRGSGGERQSNCCGSPAGTRREGKGTARAELRSGERVVPAKADRVRRTQGREASRESVGAHALPATTAVNSGTDSPQWALSPDKLVWMEDGLAGA